MVIDGDQLQKALQALVPLSMGQNRLNGMISSEETSGVLAGAWKGKEWCQLTISKHPTACHSDSTPCEDPLATKLLVNSSSMGSQRTDLSLAGPAVLEDLTKDASSDLRGLSSELVRRIAKLLGLTSATRMNLLGPGPTVVLIVAPH